MSYLAVALEVHDLRRSYQFYVEELRAFRLGGTRFYGDSGLEGMMNTDEVFLEWVGSPGLELSLRRTSELPRRISEHDVMILVVDRIDEEFARLSRAPLASGAAVLSKSVLGTPIGDLFWMRDPSGYRLQLLSRV